MKIKKYLSCHLPVVFDSWKGAPNPRENKTPSDHLQLFPKAPVGFKIPTSTSDGNQNLGFGRGRDRLAGNVTDVSPRRGFVWETTCFTMGEVDSKPFFLVGCRHRVGWGGRKCWQLSKKCGDNVPDAHIEMGRLTYTFSLECGKLFHVLYVHNPYMVMLLIGSEILDPNWKMSKTQWSIPGIESDRVDLWTVVQQMSEPSTLCVYTYIPTTWKKWLAQKASVYFDCSIRWSWVPTSLKYVPSVRLVSLPTWLKLMIYVVGKCANRMLGDIGYMGFTVVGTLLLAWFSFSKGIPEFCTHCTFSPHFFTPFLQLCNFGFRRFLGS